MSCSFPVQKRAGDWRTVGFLTEKNLFTFHPQSHFKTFEEIVASVPDGQKWSDPYNFEHPRFEKDPILVWPKDVPAWADAQEFKLAVAGRGDVSAMDPSDVCQGSIGNCWFMSSMAALANVGLVKNLFTRVDEDKGVYEVQLFSVPEHDEGVEPIHVCVDSRVHMLEGFQRPVYCYSDEAGELWPTLLEKAFAKAIKDRGGSTGYKCMESGLFSVGLRHLLGGFARVFLPVEDDEESDGDDAAAVVAKDRKERAATTAPKTDGPPRRGDPPFKFPPQKLSEEWKERFARGHIIGVSFAPASDKPVGPSGELGGISGLVSGHAYTVLDMRECQRDDNKEKILLVRVRNPWGKHGASNPNLEWTGDWSDTSALWAKNPRARSACNMNVPPAADGCFWMSIDDVCRYCDTYEAGDGLGCDITYNDWKDVTYRPCARCGRHIVAGYVTALGATWHGDCFSCYGCESALEGSFFTMDAPKGAPCTKLPLDKACMDRKKADPANFKGAWELLPARPEPETAPEFGPGCLQLAHLDGASLRVHTKGSTVGHTGRKRKPSAGGSNSGAKMGKSKLASRATASAPSAPEQPAAPPPPSPEEIAKAEGAIADCKKKHEQAVALRDRAKSELANAKEKSAAATTAFLLAQTEKTKAEAALAHVSALVRQSSEAEVRCLKAQKLAEAKLQKLLNPTAPAAAADADAAAAPDAGDAARRKKRISKPDESATATMSTQSAPKMATGGVKSSAGNSGMATATVSVQSAPKVASRAAKSAASAPATDGPPGPPPPMPRPTTAKPAADSGPMPAARRPSTAAAGDQLRSASAPGAPTAPRRAPRTSSAAAPAVASKVTAASQNKAAARPSTAGPGPAAAPAAGADATLSVTAPVPKRKAKPMRKTTRPTAAALARLNAQLAEVEAGSARSPSRSVTMDPDSIRPTTAKSPEYQDAYARGYRSGFALANDTAPVGGAAGLLRSQRI